MDTRGDSAVIRRKGTRLRLTIIDSAIDIYDECAMTSCHAFCVFVIDINQTFLVQTIGNNRLFHDYIAGPTGWNTAMIYWMKGNEMWKTVVDENVHLLVPAFGIDCVGPNECWDVQFLREECSRLLTG